MGDESGLRFDHYGTVLSSGQFTLPSLDASPCSLEVWLRPADTWKTGTVLAFYNAVNSREFSLQQSDTDLVLRREIGDEHYQTRLDVNEVFRKDKQVLITVTSDGQGVAVFINGNLAARSPRFELSAKDLTGTLIVANSPLQNNNWLGILGGIAIYNSELRAAEVYQHYDEWTKKRKPTVGEGEHIFALYLFDERSGNLAHNSIRPGNDLYIPERYMVVHQLLLEPPWREFVRQGSDLYRKNVFLNVCGFIPLGFVFAAQFTSIRGIKQAALATIILGASVSLIIEILQSYLPTRNSGVTDLITNTFGTGVGVALYGAAAFSLVRVRATIP